MNQLYQMIKKEMMQKLSKVDSEIDNLYVTPAQLMPFGPSLVNHVFLLKRDKGSILMYGSKSTDLVSFADYGGVNRHYLNHNHEAGFMSKNSVAPIYCHKKERAAVAEKVDVAHTFTTRHKLDDDFEIIPTPGHTSGTTCYLWDNGEHRILFSGDMLVPRNDQWQVVVLDENLRLDYINSLKLIRELDFDILLPWTSNEGDPLFAKTTPSNTKIKIDETIKRVKNGGKR